MFHLLSIEWLKIKKYRTVQVISAVFFVLIIIWNYAVSAGMFHFGANGNINIISNAYSFPEVWDNVAYWTKFFTALIAIILVILVTNEYQYRTNRQNVIDGLSRMDFFHSKWMLALVMSITISLFTFILGLAFGIANGGVSGNVFSHLYMLLYVFLLTLNYFGFALTLSFFTKRSGATIALFLAYNYIIELMLQKSVNFMTGTHAGDFLPLQSSAELIGFPLVSTAKQMMGLGSRPNDMVYVLASLVWIALYYLIGKAKLEKSDW